MCLMINQHLAARPFIDISGWFEVEKEILDPDQI